MSCNCISNITTELRLTSAASDAGAAGRAAGRSGLIWVGARFSGADGARRPNASTGAFFSSTPPPFPFTSFRCPCLPAAAAEDADAGSLALACACGASGAEVGAGSSRCGLPAWACAQMPALPSASSPSHARGPHHDNASQDL
eukprot:642725-Rhodomonas_salina.1